MIVYGFNKVFLIQFWAPTPTDLAQTYGDLVADGARVAVRRLLGPVHVLRRLARVLGRGPVVVPADGHARRARHRWRLANVVMLNFCYAISVKLFSLTLGALAVCIAAADYRRIVAFCLQRRVAPVVLVPYPLSPGRERLRRLLKVAWIAMVVIGTAYHCIRVQLRVHERPALWGAYDVETM